MQDRLPQSRSDAVLQARTGHITVLRELLPYIWPANRPDLRLRVVFALGRAGVQRGAAWGEPARPGLSPGGKRERGIRFQQ